MKLYHFTRLLNLPRILREGIVIGEVPISPNVRYAERPKAANLTSNKNQTGQLWCSENRISKVAIRLTVDVPENELTSFQEVAKQYNTSPEWLERLGSARHRRQWFYAFAGVHPSQIRKVERLVNGQYRNQSHGELKTLVAAIERELGLKWLVEFETTGLNAGAERYRIKPGYSESWLIDG